MDIVDQLSSHKDANSTLSDEAIFAQRLQELEKLAHLMDVQFTIPGTDIKMGLDSVLGLVPVIGDSLGLGVSGYIIARAKLLGAKKRDISKMSVNVFIDWLIGLVPFIGDVFDIGWRANMRNVEILRKRLKKQGLV